MKTSEPLRFYDIFRGYKDVTLEINELKQKFYDNVWKFEQSKVKNLHSHFFKLPKILIFRRLEDFYWLQKMAEKMVSQQKNERDLMIYTEQMLYLQKLIFNIWGGREVRNVTDITDFNWDSILRKFYTDSAT